MKVIFIGDIIGQPGREILERHLPDLIEQEKPDFVIANGENAAGGKGITAPIAADLIALGINVITLGNHTFDRREAEEALRNPKVIRPANYPPGVPGSGFGVYTTAKNEKIAVVNLMGRVYLPHIDCPFRKANEILDKLRSETRAIIVDLHAEVTSEKQAMGYYLDDRVSAVIGTHTHIPTADETILAGGTAYLTDVGMTGPSEGVIGMDKELVIKRFLTAMPQRFEVAGGSSVLQGCVIEIESGTGRAVGIRRFSKTS